MYFGPLFREYREEYLNIRQKEAANALNIDAKILSNYELKKREIPIDFLPTFQTTFHIPDDYFLAMIHGRPLKTVRHQNIPSQPERAKEVQSYYYDSFIERHRPLIERSQDLRELLLLIEQLPTKERNDWLKRLKKATEQHVKEQTKA